ncbi:MAG: hypothetical protein EYC62_02025 [Alphaproteobacteria bacterium]|nr:MAG: hypothetical protein EYC62_02025 [Alphaproteobacteria bacterium]
MNDQNSHILSQNLLQNTIEEYVRNVSNQNITPRDLYDQVIQEVERPLIQYALQQCRGNQIRAAKMLGINRNTLHKKIKTLNISVRKKANASI